MSDKVMLLKDIIDMIQFENIDLYYKGSYCDSYNTIQSIKESSWINDRVCCITYDDSCLDKTIEIYLTSIDRKF